MEKRNIIKETKEKGITLITLTIAVCIMIVISSVLIYNAQNGVKMKTLKMVQNDIEMLDDKINSYYVKYGALPITHRYTNIKFKPQANDIRQYYVIDLNALEGLSLNLGKDFLLITETTTKAQIQKYDDLYIIDKQSHHVYYAKGIEMDGEMYYTTTVDEKINLEKIPEDIKTSLSKKESSEDWAKEVVLIGTGKIKELVQNNKQIEKYVFTQEKNVEYISETDWVKTSKNEKLQVTVEETITENGNYYFWTMDNDGKTYKSNEVVITNIDNAPPTVGTIIAKKENSEGEDYKLGTLTDKNVYIEKVDGTDNESGHKQTTYTVKQGITTLYENITESITLTENGIYTIIVTTEDNIGNIATSNPITIKIDKIVPVLTLKHNDVSGEIYESGTWTKDSLYGEVIIDTSTTGRTLEKYQYSFNPDFENSWKDISSEEVPGNIDYTTTFPLSEGKPEWFTGPTTPNSSNNSNGSYYFEVQANGTLKPNNSGKSSTTANSYFEIDLTDYPESELELTINATISSENNYDFGYATITESTTAPSYNSSTGRFVYISGSTRTANHTKILTGGKKYYLHIGYRKDGSANSNQDTFIINNISLKSDALGKGINFTNYTKTDNKVTFTLNEDIEKEIYIRAIYTGENNIGKYGSGTKIQIDKTAPVIKSATSICTSPTTAKANLTVKEEGSGLQEYYISTEETAPTESTVWEQQALSEFYIEGLNTETTYYIWLKDNVGNVSEKQTITTTKPNYSIDGTKYVETLAEAITESSEGSIIKLLNDYTDATTVTFDENVTFDVQEYILTRTKTITVNNSKTVGITGTGKITTGTTNVSTITNNGTLTISNSITIENMSTSSSYAPIYTSSSSVTNINDNVQIIGYYRGIYNYNGTVNINGGYIEATYLNSSAYGIYNSSSSSKTYINSGKVKGYYGVYNSYSSAFLEMSGGKVIGTGAYGIYVYGTTNIYGGRIEGKTYGVYSNATNKVTIGRQEDELSTTQPAIYGGSYGIYMNTEAYSFNFYNGVILSNAKENAYRGLANLRENHMIYTYLDYEVEQKYCTILTQPVTEIKMEATPTEYTNKDVTVKIAYPNNEGLIKVYSENGVDWNTTNYNNEQLIISENKTVYARTINEMGMVTEEKQIEVNNIDKEKPVVTITPMQTNYIVTNENETKDINFTIKATDLGISGLDIVKYAWAKEGENIEYIDFTNEVTINKQNLGVGTYNLYLKVIDKVGNKADIEQIRYNVKYQEPVAKIEETKYLTIQEAIDTCSKNTTKIEIVEKEYSILDEAPDWFTGPINATYYFQTQGDGTLKPNNSGQSSTTANSYFEIDLTDYPEAEIELAINATISSESNYDFGYAEITESATPPTFNKNNTYYIKVSGSTTTQDHTKTITGGKKYYLHIGYYKDSSQNSNQDTFIINSINIKGKMPQIVLDDPTTIEILKSTEEEFCIYEGQNIKLDLRGYRIGSSNTETPICTNNGTLTIIDSSTEKTGKLESLNATAIENVSTGTLTIGNNATSIENEMPTIYGKKVGIKNEGTFNFYDGKIQGISPIQGNIADTPDQYGAVTTDYNSGITTVQLGIVSGYKARIEWIYYTTVQDAINATKHYTDGKRDTVTIIKDLQIQEILEVSSIKNFILDLDGNKITATVKDTIINNYGNLEIADNSKEQAGTLEIERTSGYSYGIYNNGDGNITITGGTINSGNNNSTAYGIYNNSTGSVIVKEGTISSRYGIYNTSTGNVIVEGGTISSMYGIYNNTTGNITIKGGMISCNKSTSSSAYGIYNAGAGNVIVEGGTISCSNSKYSSYGIYNNTTGNITINGGTISCSSISNETSSNIYGIYNTKGSVIINGGMISCNKSGSYNAYGIYNASTGNVIVEGGTISCSNSTTYYNAYGIYNIGSVVIGNENNEIVSQENPYIKALYTGTSTDKEGCGLYSPGNLEFYNGKIEGNIALLGKVTKSREEYKIIKEKTNKTEIIYLKPIESKEDVVQIDDEKYTSLQEAIDSIEENEEKTIKVIRDFDLNENIQFNKNIILDLNGCIITNNYYAIENVKNLKIIDSTEEKQGRIDNFNTITGLENNGEGTIEIEGGTISNSNSSISNDKRYAYGIYNNSTGSVIVKEGTISGMYGIYNRTTGDVIVEGGTINGDYYGIYNQTNGNITVTGGMISGRYCAIENESDGSVTVKGGIINCNNNDYNNSAIGVRSVRSGTIIIEGGTINSSNSSGSAYGIDGANIIVKGGTISSSGARYVYGMYIDLTAGNVTVEGGTISASGKNNVYGIYNEDDGNITIGIKGDGLVSQEEPNIKGEYTGTSTADKCYGIYNTNGSLYYYDGKIEGTTKAVYDTITEREDSTELNYNEDETILTLSTESMDIAQIEERTYKTLEEAINSIGTEQTTIKLLRNATFTNQDISISIPQTKNIILDLNGYKIISAIPETLIQNNGILEIIDTSGSQMGTLMSNTEKTINNVNGAQLIITRGNIENRKKYSIYNQGNVIIKGGTINTSASLLSYEDFYGIYNNGTGNVTVKGGTINTSAQYGKHCFGIYNYNTGNVIVEGGTISTSNRSNSSYGIYNYSTGNITMTGGIISGSSSGNVTWGIYNNSTGNITMTGGTINSSGSGNSYGIYNYNAGNITIGIKGDTLVSQEEPYIQGKYTSSYTYSGYGIYNERGCVYYYDGKIEGSTRAISGNITEIENLTELSITNNNTSEIIQLEQKETNAVSINGTEYNSIQRAIQSCGVTPSTITLLRNVNPGLTIKIEETQNITIDLNGFTINNYQEITNKGTLKIKDSSDYQTGKIVGLADIAIVNQGIVELQSGSISDSGYGINNQGTLTISGGSITNNTYGIYNSSGTINITSGTITSNTYGVYSVGEITQITGGNITSNEYGIYASSGIVNIASTGISSNAYGVYNAGGIITIKEGTQISSTIGIYNSIGTVNIGETGTVNTNTPIIAGEEYGLVNVTSATVYMYDGQIKGKTGATKGYITYTETGYSVATKTEGEHMIDYLALSGTISTVAQVNGIDFSNLQSAINSAIGEDAQTITLTNGIITSSTFTIAEGQNIILDMNGKTISSDLEITIINNGNLTIIDTSGNNVAKISSTVGTAISNSGTLTLGQDDGTVTQDLINIEGTTYGIQNSGTLNFYDGTINGASAVSGRITARATGYVIRTTTVNSKERYYLST